MGGAGGGLELPAGAAAGINQSHLREPAYCGFVDRVTLRLPVRAGRALGRQMWTFVKCNSEPFQVFDDLLIGSGDVSGEVCILHSQKKKAAVLADILLGQEGRAQVTQMQATSWAWCIPAHGLITLYRTKINR